MWWGGVRRDGGSGVQAISTRAPIPTGTYLAGDGHDQDRDKRSAQAASGRVEDDAHLGSRFVLPSCQSPVEGEGQAGRSREGSGPHESSNIDCHGRIRLRRTTDMLGQRIDICVLRYANVWRAPMGVLMAGDRKMEG